jgi:hypothetical protein
MLERLIYQSKASQDFGTLHLFNLLTEARLRNKRLGITGHLLYLDGQFTQCIEGKRASIDALWESLQRDVRHYEIELLARYAISERRFADWTMAFSSYQSFYVHGMTGFFPASQEAPSPLAAACKGSQVSDHTVTREHEMA